MNSVWWCLSSEILSHLSSHRQFYSGTAFWENLDWLCVVKCTSLTSYQMLHTVLHPEGPISVCLCMRSLAYMMLVHVTNNRQKKNLIATNQVLELLKLSKQEWLVYMQPVLDPQTWCLIMDLHKNPGFNTQKFLHRVVFLCSDGSFSMDQKGI